MNNRHVIQAHDSVLNTEWTPPDRPYSQNELKDMEMVFKRHLQLSDISVHHPECGHSYLIKKNGLRYKKILEDPNDIGNCSMCWKLSRTPKGLKEKVWEFIELNKPEDRRRTFFHFSVFKIFYTWLYDETYASRDSFH